MCVCVQWVEAEKLYKNIIFCSIYKKGRKGERERDDGIIIIKPKPVKCGSTIYTESRASWWYDGDGKMWWWSDHSSFELSCMVEK